MRDDQSKRHQLNPGEDNTQWSDRNHSREDRDGSSYSRMDQDQDSKGPGRSYRTDDYYNRVADQGVRSDNANREQSQRYSSSSNNQQDNRYGKDYSRDSETPYERASYGRDMSDNFSSGRSSRGTNPNEAQWNQNNRQSGFGQSNQQDQSYGQQYGRSSSQFTGSQSGQYGNSNSGSRSDSYQPRGADQGSYGQDTGVNSRFQGGYPYGYDANNSQLGQSGRSQNQYDQGQYGRSHESSSRQGMNQGGSLRSQDNSENQYGQRVDHNYQGHFQGWDNDRQNYRGNDAQKSIYGSAGFGSLGTGNEMLKARSSNRSEHDHQDYNSRNSGMSFSDTYHPDARYGQTSNSSNSSFGSHMDRDNLSGKQTPASYSGSGRQTPNSYMGKGPKSFKRSDERIREEISETFTRHHEVDASDVEIEVKDGEVTLTGFVPERRMKYLAEDLAEKSMGVKDVTNNLRVRRETSAFSDSSSSDSMSASSDSEKSDKKTSTPGAGKSSDKKNTTLNPNH